MSHSEDVVVGVMARNMGILDAQQVSRAIASARSSGTSLAAYLVSSGTITSSIYDQIVSTSQHFARYCRACHQITYLDPRQDLSAAVVCERCGGACGVDPPVPPALEEAVDPFAANQPPPPPPLRAVDPFAGTPPPPPSGPTPRPSSERIPRPPSGRQSPPPSRSFPKRMETGADRRRQIAATPKPQTAKQRQLERVRAPWARSPDAADEDRVDQREEPVAPQPEPVAEKERIKAPTPSTGGGTPDPLSMSDSDDEPKSFFKRFDPNVDQGAPIETQAEPAPPPRAARLDLLEGWTWVIVLAVIVGSLGLWIVWKLMAAL